MACQFGRQGGAPVWAPRQSSVRDDSVGLLDRLAGASADQREQAQEIGREGFDALRCRNDRNAGRRPRRGGGVSGGCGGAEQRAASSAPPPPAVDVVTTRFANLSSLGGDDHIEGLTREAARAPMAEFVPDQRQFGAAPGQRQGGQEQQQEAPEQRQSQVACSMASGSQGAHETPAYVVVRCSL